jgi:AcrR family transcriptional regulator
MVETILNAAARVFVKEGYARATTNRIAAAAGVSVGSLYQYFPNKQAVLFRLQTAEWEENSAFLAAILVDGRQSWEARLKAMIRRFYYSECEEAPFRKALDDAAPLYHQTPEAIEHHKANAKILSDFLAEALPRLGPAKRAFAIDMLKTTVSAIGNKVSEQERPPAQIDALAAATADMLIAWLKGL